MAEATKQQSTADIMKALGNSKELVEAVNLLVSVHEQLKLRQDITFEYPAGKELKYQINFKKIVIKPKSLIHRI